MASKAENELQEKREAKAIKWATTHGAPIRLLVGWNPDDGTWEKDSPVWKLLDDISKGSHVSVAGRRVNMDDVVDLQYKGSEHNGQSEDRLLIPIEHRVFVDLYRSINTAEADAETELSNKVYEKALADGRLGIDFLGRRWPNRWKEQPLVSTADEDDLRERAVTNLLSDPAKAMALAAMAADIEDEVEEAERDT